MTGQNVEIMTKISFLKVCSSHLTKNMFKDVNRNFKKNQILFICSLIGGIFDLDSFGDIESYLRNFLTILFSRATSKDLTDALKNFENFAKYDEWPETSLEMPEDENFKDFDLIYKCSPFFQHFDAIIRTMKFPQGAESPNEFFNPKFAAVFMKKYVSFLPFWSCALTKFRNANPTRANNGYVEGKNN